MMNTVDTDLYNIKVQTLDGESTTLAPYHGKVMMIVNVASKCGFAPTYQVLQDLYMTYGDQGFVVLGFPCNQFMKQEPGNEDKIREFCDVTYHVTFPMFAKIKVNGQHAHPLYQYLKNTKPGFMGTKLIKWNFTKFLVDRQGQVVTRFAPIVQDKETLAAAIKALL
jgi:glutathione peroxidase